MKNNVKIGAVAFAILASSTVAGLVYAQDNNQKPKFSCVLTDQMSADKVPGDPKDTFDTKTPEIFAVCNSKDLQKGQTVTAAWIAADTHKAAPDNYKIQEKMVDVPAEAEVGKNLTFNFSLTKPTKDWPAGRYHVDIFVDKEAQPAKVVNFTISANKTTE